MYAHNFSEQRALCGCVCAASIHVSSAHAHTHTHTHTYTLGTSPRRVCAICAAGAWEGACELRCARVEMQQSAQKPVAVVASTAMAANIPCVPHYLCN